MTKLKPCPFCGCEDIGTEFEICQRVFFCNDCGVSVIAVDGDDGKAWNTRPGEDAAVKAERDRCAKIAKTYGHHALWPLHKICEYNEIHVHDEFGIKLSCAIAAAIRKGGE